MNLGKYEQNEREVRNTQGGGRGGRPIRIRITYIMQLADQGRQPANIQTTSLQPERQIADEEDSEKMIACKF